MQFSTYRHLFLALLFLLPLQQLSTTGQAAAAAVYTPMANNFFVFYDPSTAMTVPYKDTGMTRLEMEKQILVKSNAAMPDLDIQAGLYPHWKNVMWLPGSPESFHPYYRLQNYDREKYGKALEQLPVISSGPPMLQFALMKLEYLLGLPGRTEVFLFTNGEDSRVKVVPEPAPLEQARKLAKEYDVCFTIISSATTPEARKLLDDIATVNGCSQVMDFDDLAAHPERLFGKLYAGGDSLGNVLFDFDRADIKPEFRPLLDKVGNYLIANPRSHAVLSGFTDNRGSAAYNIRLSERRAESVRNYLKTHFNISPDRLQTYWYGYADPVAPNDTEAGRRLNRRVDIALRDN
jgi:OOP family OmpA-OmpF porin